MGKLSAFPFKTPPEIGARGGVGFASGGGGSSGIVTFAGAATTFPAPGPDGIAFAAVTFSDPILVTVEEWQHIKSICGGNL